jgi:hypothetical protein
VVRFYDPKDESDLARVERLLAGGGIEYALTRIGAGSFNVEIQVAEEDLPQAEDLLLRASAKG